MNIGMALTKDNEFQEIFIEKDFDEEQPNGTLLLDLRNYFDENLSPSSSWKEMKKEFLSDCSYFYFINSNEETFWNIYSTKLDREELCPNEKICSLNCRLYLNDMKRNMKLIELKIHLKDVDDHRGQFSQEKYFFQMDRRLSSNGFRFQLEQIQDEDMANDDDDLFYVLRLNSNRTKFPFELNYDKKNHLLELIFIDNHQPLFNVYQVELIAINRKRHDEIEDSCLIEIEVRSNDIEKEKISENNIRVQFNQTKYRFILYSWPRTNFLGQIQLEKSTNTSSKRISYRLNYQNDYVKEILDLNPSTGELFLKNLKYIDFKEKLIEVDLHAFDSNNFLTKTSIELIFNISEPIIDEHQINLELFLPKLFTRDGSRKNDHEKIIFIEENHRVPLTIAQIYLSHPYRLFQWNSSLNSTTDRLFDLQSIDEHFYDLILLKSFDYESVQQCTLNMFFVFDQPITLRQSLMIFIDNLNDWSPSFVNEHFYFQIEENLFFSTAFTRFQAIDHDQLEPLHYYLNGTISDFFLNSTTGELFLLHSFDRELQSNISFDICADDQVHHSCQPVLIDILDVNDHRCTFSVSNVTLFIQEHLPSDTILYEFHAIDLDSDENSNLHYSLRTISSYLHLDSTLGILQTTSNMFDYRSIQQFSTTIVACDNPRSPSHSLCCSLDLQIQILDHHQHRHFLLDFSHQYEDQHHYSLIINFINQTTMPLLHFRPSSTSFIQNDPSSSLYFHPSTHQLIISKNDTDAIDFPFRTRMNLSLGTASSILLDIQIYRYRLDNQLNIVPFSTLFLLPLFVLLLPVPLLILYLINKKKNQNNHTFLTTPSRSTTSISNKSIHQNQNVKYFQTYYSFDHSLTPQSTHI